MKVLVYIKFLVALFLFSISISSNGQNSYDTLSFYDENFTSDQAKKEFIEAINFNMNSSYQDARYIASSFYDYAIDKQDSDLIKTAYFQKCLIHFQDAKYDSSLVCLLSAQEIAEIQSDTAMLIDIERTIGSVYLSTKIKDKAFFHFNNSLDLSKLAADSSRMAKALNNLSILSTQAEDYQKALNYLKRSLDLKIAFAPKTARISTLINISKNYKLLKNYDKALNNLDRAKEIAEDYDLNTKLSEIYVAYASTYEKMGKVKETEEAYLSSIKISTELNAVGGQNFTIKKYAEFLMAQKRWKEAESKLETILIDLNEKQNPILLSEIYYDLGKIAYESKNLIKAQVWLNQAISITDVQNQETLVKAYNILSLITYLNQDYEIAYHNLRISNMIADIVNKKNNDERVKELQVKYDAINDKKSIENLIEITELKESEKQKSNFYFLVTFGLFVITLGAAFALARQVSHKQKQSTELQIQMDDNNRKTKDLIKAHNLAEQGLKVKSEFIAMISHEIRTPMNAVIGMSSLLEETPLNELQRNYLNNISISSNNLLILLNDILDFSRIESGKVSIKLQPADIHKELSHVVNMFTPLANEKDLDFQISLSDEIPSIAFVDAPRLRQVVVNLLSNAIKFTHKGFVNLTVTIVKSEPTLNGQIVTMRISVKDSGIGVPKDKQKEIFSSFNQLDSKVSRQYAGVGLGLSISQGILGMMGSNIYLESEFAKGSEFWFELKMKAEKEHLQPKKSEKKPSSKVKFDANLGNSAPLKILIAEDNEINQRLLQINLNKMGYNPIIVSNGQEAIDQIKVQEFDIVFMDIQMPIMDGLAATKEIIRMYGTNKPIIVAVTANAMGTDKESYITAGMDDYISKPYTTSEIETCLKNWYAHLNA